MQPSNTLNNRRVSYAERRANKERAWFNCWGATLFVLDQTKRLQWVEEYQMQIWLNCNTEPIYRPRKPGDIVTVHRFGLSHTAVYIGKGKYFHKRGMSSAEVTDLAGVRKIYGGTYSYRRMIGTQNV